MTTVPETTVFKSLFLLPRGWVLVTTIRSFRCRWCEKDVWW